MLTLDADGRSLPEQPLSLSGPEADDRLVLPGADPGKDVAALVLPGEPEGARPYLGLEGRAAMTGDWMAVLDGDGLQPDDDFLPVELKDDGRLVLPAPEPGKADVPLVLPGDEEGTLPGLLLEAEPFSPNGPWPPALDEHGRPIDDGWMF